MVHIPGHVADDIATSILSQQNDLETAMVENLTASTQMSNFLTNQSGAPEVAFAKAGAGINPQGLGLTPAPAPPDPKWEAGLYDLVINRSQGQSPDILSKRLDALRGVIASDSRYKTADGAMELAEVLKAQQFKPAPTVPTTTAPTTTASSQAVQDAYWGTQGDFSAQYEKALTLDPNVAMQYLDTQLEGDAMSQAFIDDYFDYTGINLETQMMQQEMPEVFTKDSAFVDSAFRETQLSSAVATAKAAQTAMDDAELSEKEKIDAYLKVVENLSWDEKMVLAEKIGAFEGLTADQIADAKIEGTGDWTKGIYTPSAVTETGTETVTEDGEIVETAVTSETGETGEDGVDVGAGIESIFGGLSASSLEEGIKSRMAELGTADLSAYIQQQLGTVTTPDYSGDITQRYGEMGDALDTAASERRRILGESAERGRGQIDVIKRNLGEELGRFEAGRVEQQTALEQKVIDRTTEFEQALTERLTDIRADLGEQVTSEFEEVAALAETLTASQATSSRDAMSRLTAIGDMAAAARMSAPAELSAEALTALNDLEFQVTNQIAQSLAEGQADIDIDMANALLGETMRQGDFATQQSATLANAMIDEKLRGTTYADQIDMMQAQALMDDDQYVRQFDDDVSMQMAQAQLQNLFGTQDYERQLDMLNLQRGWDTADTLQQRGWQTADMLQQRGWDTADMDQQRLYDLEDALLEDQEAPMGIVEKLREQFPKAPEQLMITASSVAGMDWEPIMDTPTTDEKEYLKYRDQLLKGPDGNVILDANGQPTSTDPEYEGANASFYMAGDTPVYFLQKQLSASPAEIYLRTLTGQLTEDEREEIENKGGFIPEKNLNISDSATLKALVDALRAMSEQELAAILAERDVKLTEIPTGGTPVTGTGNLEGLLSQVTTSPALESDWWMKVQEEMLGRTG